MEEPTKTDAAYASYVQYCEKIGVRAIPRGEWERRTNRVKETFSDFMDRGTMRGKTRANH